MVRIAIPNHWAGLPSRTDAGKKPIMATGIIRVNILTHSLVKIVRGYNPNVTMLSNISYTLKQPTHLKTIPDNISAQENNTVSESASNIKNPIHETKPDGGK